MEEDPAAATGKAAASPEGCRRDRGDAGLGGRRALAEPGQAVTLLQLGKVRWFNLTTDGDKTCLLSFQTLNRVWLPDWRTGREAVRCPGAGEPG